MHDCASILDSIKSLLLRGLPCFHDFSHGAGCRKRSYAHAYMRKLARAAL